MKQIELNSTIVVFNVKHQGTAIIADKGIFENGETILDISNWNKVQIENAIAFAVRQASGDAVAGLKQGKGKDVDKNETLEAFQKRQQAVVLDKFRRIESGAHVLTNEPGVSSEDPVISELILVWAANQINPDTGKTFTAKALEAEVAKAGSYLRFTQRAIAAAHGKKYKEVTETEVSDTMEANKELFEAKYKDMEAELAARKARAAAFASPFAV